MRAEIISIGTEILLGEILDSNSQYVAARLPALGIDLYFKHTVGDISINLTIRKLRRRSYASGSHRVLAVPQCYRVCECF